MKNDTLLNAVLYAAGTALFLYVCIGFYYLFMPATHWVKYYDIYPVLDTVPVKEPIAFVSHVERYRQVDLKYSDILFCKKDNMDEFIRFSQMSSEHIAAGPITEAKVTWPYMLGVPHPAQCYLESNILLELPMGHKKSFSINGLERGHVFKVIAEEG